MKCPRCGNEVSSEEAFCGQCGTPNVAPQALPTEMVHTPPPGNGRPTPYVNNGNAGMQNPYGAPPSVNRQGVSFSPASSSQSMPPAPSNQQTGFYQDATEAMSLPPRIPNMGYPPQPLYPVTPPSGTYPPQGTQYGGFPSQPAQVPPLQTGNYAGQPYSQQPMMQGGQEYRNVPTPPRKQQNGAIIFIVSICLVVALLSVVGVGTLYVLRNRNAAPKDTQTPGIAPTATTVPTEAPTPTATVAPTATTAPTPTPTTIPTATPVTGFAYCGLLCETNGFSTQYPLGWSAASLTAVAGVQFLNPAATEQSATFKTPGATTSSPNDLVANDLQQNFATNSGYTVVTPTSTASIGGETWFEEVITYQGTGSQIEQVEVYANVHQGKAYILELQASQDQFTAVTPNFVTIKNQFQFL